MIAPTGAGVSAPAQLKLTAEQAKRRAHLLKPGKGKGSYEVAGSGSVMFKCGETFQIDQPDRLSRALFDWEEPKKKAAAKKAVDADAAAKAKAAAEAEAKKKADAEAAANAASGGGSSS